MSNASYIVTTAVVGLRIVKGRLLEIQELIATVAAGSWCLSRVMLKMWKVGIAELKIEMILMILQKLFFPHLSVRPCSSKSTFVRVFTSTVAAAAARATRCTNTPSHCAPFGQFMEEGLTFCGVYQLSPLISREFKYSRFTVGFC